MTTTPENPSLQTNSSIRRFGRYEVIKQLGEGAMGRVFLSEDPVLQRLVAIKVIALENSINDTSKQEFLQRFTFEAQASAKLTHPSIVTVYDAGEQDGVPWIAFEYIKGERLDQLLRREGVLPFDKIRSIILQIASALTHAHELRIIHRDIKPSNILIDSRSGIAKLADFGVVKAPWIGLTQSGVCLGSPGYMSPEQIDGSEVDARSDLFSLGVVIYELISGTHPFLRDSVPATFFATINQDYTPLKQLRTDIPPDLEKAVSLLLKTSKDERISSASALISLFKDSISIEHRSISSPRPMPSAQDPDFKTIFRSMWLKIKKSTSGYLLKFQTWVSSDKKKEKAARYVFAPISRFAIFTLKYIQKSFMSGFKMLKHQQKQYAGKIIWTLFLIPAIIIVVILFPLKTSKRTTTLKVDIAIPSYVDKLDALIGSNNLDSAYALIVKIPESENTGWADFLLGRIELKKGNYTLADSQFKEALEKRKSILRYERNDILNDLEIVFKKGKAPESLISTVINTLKIAEHKRIHTWLQSPHYWLRWNAVRVIESSGKKVDLVNVYLIDLNSTASIRTRIRAAEKLGELGDKRAIPLLQEIGARGIRDPFVSATARDVISRYFKDDTSSNND